jgi:hypothetical protein
LGIPCRVPFEGQDQIPGHEIRIDHEIPGEGPPIDQNRVGLGHWHLQGLYAIFQILGGRVELEQLSLQLK